MKVIEANEVVLRSIRGNATLHFTVKTVLMGGYTLVSTGPITVRLRLSCNSSLKKGDKIEIHPVTLDVAKV